MLLKISGLRSLFTRLPWQMGHKCVVIDTPGGVRGGTRRYEGEGYLVAFKRPAPAVWGNGLWGSVGWSRAIL